MALLDLQISEVDGISVVRLLQRRFLPLVIFVTAYDEYAVKAFELNAIDYLTKPVAEARLREAIRRASDRLDRDDARQAVATSLRQALRAYDHARPLPRLERIPIRRKDDILLLPISQLVSVVADGELLHLTTAGQENSTIAYRRRISRRRLDPQRFIKLDEGTVVSIDFIARVTPVSGWHVVVKLRNGDELDVSRIQSRLLRERLLKL